MTSSCAVRRELAAKFACAARLFAESAVLLATSGKSGIDYTSLCDQTIEAQGSGEVAFGVSKSTSLRISAERTRRMARGI